jgi:hypothetical protein
MILGLFSDKDFEPFARGLAKEVASRLPPSKLAQKTGSDAKLKQSIEKVMAHIALSAANYRRTHKVSVVKRIRLSKVFQDEMDTLGFEDDFIREATLALARGLT